MWWRLAAVMIGLALATPPGAVARAAGQPDLKLEYIGYNPNDTRLLEFRVVNIGDGPASGAAAHAETLSPTPGNVAKLFYPPLAPGKFASFYYVLTEPCDEHVVKAGVSAVADGEGNYDNNFFQNQVCPKLADAVPIEVGPSPRDITPAHQRPGPYTRAFKPSAVRHGERNNGASGVGCAFRPGYAPTDAVVGWRQNDELLCSQAEAHQTAVKFDLGLLDDVPNTTITKAVLTFTENPQKWTTGGGNARDVSGCVTTLAYATTNWVSQPPANGGLFPNDPFTSKLPFGDQEWYVTEEVGQWVRGARPNHGFVLRSHREADTGNDEDSCESVLTEIELTITWRVPG